MAMTKPPKLICETGENAKALRTKLGMSQIRFWSPLGVTQSCASRYESGRAIPFQTQCLLQIAYGTEKQAQAMSEWLRKGASD